MGLVMIMGWESKKLKCANCGTEKSVKYLHNGKPYCNMCIMKAPYLRVSEVVVENKGGNKK